MMPTSVPFRERFAALSAIVTFIALILGLGSLGCRIIEPYWGENPDDGIPGQIGRYTIAGGAALDVRSGDFRLVVPAGAAPDGTTFSVFQAIEPSYFQNAQQDKVSRIPPPDGFIKLSSAYDVAVDPASMILSRPARLELPFLADALARNYPETILVACMHESTGWQLFKPAVDIDRQIAVAETTRFSRWMVVRPIDPKSKLPRLFIDSSPDVLIASSGSSFDTDVLVHLSVEGIRSGNPLGNELLLVGVNGPLPQAAIPSSPGQKFTLTTNSQGEAAIVLDSSPCVEKSSAGDAATYTMRFATTGLEPGDIASRIIIRWSIKFTDGVSFISESALNLSEAVQAPQTSPTYHPKLASVVPPDGATDVPAYTPLELTFDRDMDRASVVNAIQVLPANGIAKASWTDGKHVLLTCPQAWPAGELFTVTVATSAKSLEGAELAQAYQWSFTVRDTIDQVSPTLTALSPASGTSNMPLNTRVWLSFSKPMQHSSVEAAITAIQPALTNLTFEWSSDNSNIGILPATNWPAQTSFVFEISSSAADTDGIPLENPIRFVFQTLSTSGPTVTMIDPAPNSLLATSPRSLAFRFSRSMNKSLTAEAFSVNPAPGGTPSYQWASADSELTITWPGTFPELSAITASFSAAARDTLNLPLAGAMVFTFSTRDMSPPTVLSAIPTDGTSGVPRNTPVELTFSEKMNRTSVESAILVTPSSGGLSYAWNASETVLSIKPTTGWPADSQITLSIGTSATDNSGNSLSAKFSLAFRSSGLLAAELAGSIPASGSTGVARTTPLTLAFTQPMLESSLAGALSITPLPAAGVAIAWSSDSTIATLTPSPSWANAATITVTLGNVAQSATNLRLSATATISFTTSDTEPPAVVSLLPASGTLRVSPTASFTISFTKSMNEADVRGAISLSPPAPGVVRSRTLDSGRQFEFSWPEKLADLTEYTFTIGTGARDKAGNALLQPVSTRFTTTDTTLPVIASTWPTPDATDIPSGTSLLVDFSKTMNVNGVTVRISPLPAGALETIWSGNNRQLTLKWAGGLIPGAHYLVTIATDSFDIYGNPLATGSQFGFTVLPPDQPVPPEVVAFSADPSVTAANPDRSLRVGFSQAMDTVSVAAAVTFTPATPAQPSVAWNGAQTELTLSFPLPLAEATEYSFQISSTAKSAAGTAMGSPYRAALKTSARPRIVSGQELPPAGSLFVASSTQVSLPFSKQMNTASVESAFSLTASGAAIPGSFRWESDQCFFTPTVSLAAAVEHSIRIAATAADSGGITVGRDWIATFTTAPNVAPVVSSTIPADGATNVPAHQTIVFAFSAPMATSTVSVAVTPEALGQRSNEWSEDLRQLTMSYTGGFSSNTAYRATIADGARDRLGTGLSGPVTIAFTSETTAVPRVMAISPAVGAKDVARTTSLSLTFDIPMDRASTLAALTLAPAPAGAPEVSWTAGDTVVTLNWPNGLTLGAAYSVQLAPSAKSATGTTLGTAFSSYFTIESRPQLVSGSEYPTPAAIQIATGTTIRMTFSKTMQQASVASAFSLTANGSSVPGSFGWVANTVTFTPTSPLPASATCLVTVSTSALDSGGNTLADPISWRFDTVTTFGSSWRQLQPNDFTATDRFGIRRGHAMVSFNGRLWIIGGTDETTFFNDVWSSADGISWRSELTHSGTPGASQFSGRTNHACAVFNSRIWLTGGYIDTGTGIDVADDVWSSADGKVWRLESASAEYWARGDHTMLVFDNKLWMVAGQTYDADGRETLLGDTWYSSDGIHWIESGMTSAYFPRRLASTGVIAGKMFIWGGYGTDAAGAAGPLHDIWYSTNGSLWTRATDAASFSARHGAAHAVINGRAWMIGGYGIAPSGYDDHLNDVWTSSDGITWNRLLQQDALASDRFSPRQQAALGEAGGGIFLTGGEESNGISNDIWTME